MFLNYRPHVNSNRGVILSIHELDPQAEGSLLYALPEPHNQYLITDLVDLCSDERRRCHNVPEST